MIIVLYGNLFIIIKQIIKNKVSLSEPSPTNAHMALIESHPLNKDFL
ncbi:hypothetical protein VCRA2110O135_330036 [Vibrio crassostreae]|nr:hypothetical protein VCRA2110O135_330036 [Vibrio crassostreae]